MNFKSLEDRIEQLKKELADLCIEEELRSENRWGVYIYSTGEDKEYDLAVAIARTPVEAREAIKKEAHRTKNDADIDKLQLSIYFDVEDTIRIPLAYLCSSFRNQVPF